MAKLGSQIDNKTLFFDLWWKQKIDEKNAQRLMKDAGSLKEYQGTNGFWQNTL
jgi:oligoendopeptidase F